MMNVRVYFHDGTDRELVSAQKPLLVEGVALLVENSNASISLIFPLASVKFVECWDAK